MHKDDEKPQFTFESKFKFKTLHLNRKKAIEEESGSENEESPHT